MKNELVKKATLMKEQGFVSYWKTAVSDRKGLVSIGQISAECIGILICVCIITLVPMVASNVQDNLPAIDNGSAWSSSVNAGADLWGTALPLVNVCCLVVIVGLVLHVVISLKHRD